MSNKKKKNNKSNKNNTNSSGGKKSAQIGAENLTVEKDKKSGFFLLDFFNSFKYIGLTVLIGILIILFTYSVLLYFPVSNNTILKVDLYHQYAPFHEELREKLLNHSSLAYSWEGGLGKELISQIAYYTASPVSLLMLFFPQEGLPEAMALFSMLKIALAGGFFAYYLKKVHGRNDLTITAFGLLYGFMSFLTSYYWNIMWLDAVALFPIVAMGIEKLVKENRFACYTIALAVSVFVNFYIAFIVCVFSVLYFLVVLFSNYSLSRDGKILKKRIIYFAFSSFLGGCMAMIMIMPTAIALSHTQASDSSFPSFKIYANAIQLLENNFLGARPVVLGRNEDLPNIYSGLFSIILLPCYFANKKFPLKEKLLFAALLIFIYACSCINVLDYLIHGMHFPSNLPHRFAFIYSFIVICLAYRAFLSLKDIDIVFVITMCIIYTMIILFSEYIIVPNTEDIERVFSDRLVIINFVMMIIYIIYLLIVKDIKPEKRMLPNVVLVALIIFEAGTSALTGMSDRMTWKETDPELLSDSSYQAEWTEKAFGGKYTGTTNHSEYIKFIPGVNDALDYIEENDDDENIFHRMEVRRFKAINSGSLYHYNGVSQFSSLAYGNTSGAMEKIGIAATSNSYRYYDPTPLFNSLFNVKYILSTETEINNSPYKLLETFGTTEVAEGETDPKDKVYLYENEQPLSLGFMVNDDVKSWNLKGYNPFEIQNEFLRKATGQSFDFLKMMEIKDPSYSFITVERPENDENLDDSDFKFNYTLQAPYDLNSRIPKVEAYVYNDKEQRVFLYINAGNAKTVSYDYPGCEENGPYNRDFSTGSGFVDLGIVPADCTIKISFNLDRKGEFEKTYRTSGDFAIYAAAYDPDIYNEAYKLLDDEKLIVDNYGDDYIHGKITAQNDGIMFTSIPYDKGWSLVVDGEEQDYISLADSGVGKDDSKENGGFIGVELTKGEHEIYFKYTARGFAAGAAVSVIAIAAFIAVVIYHRRKSLKI